MIVFYCILLAALMLVTVLVIRKVNAKRRRPWLTANGILWALLGAAVILIGLEEAVLDRERARHSVYNGTILSEMYYEGVADGYHVVYATSLFAGETILIPQEQATVSFISKLYKPVNLYCPNGGEPKDAVRIVPHCFSLLIGFCVADFIAWILLNIVWFCCRQIKRRKKQTDS